MYASTFSAPADPFALTELPTGASGLWNNNSGYSDTNGKSVRANGFTINPALKTLVLIISGQSNYATQAPTSYTPTHPTVVDNFNIYDGQMYAATGVLLGSTWAMGLGSGHFGGQLADLLITNGKFDRVILVPNAVGGSSVTSWSAGVLSGRMTVTMNRLKARGVTPGVTGLTFAMIWGQGETDNGLLNQAQYTAAFNIVAAELIAAGFSGRIFVNQQTWIAGTTSAAIRAAQAAVVNGTTIFAGADADTLTAGSRQADNTHFNDAGLASLTTLVYNAMHASGAPF